MSDKHYKHLGIQERKIIEDGLNAKNSISDIARDITCSPATVAREIVRNRSDDGYRKPGNLQFGNSNVCLHRQGCKITGLCKHCTSPDVRSCGFCRKGKCRDLCERFEEEVCNQISASPHACNGCGLGRGCRLHRYRYSAKAAQAASDARNRECREGIDVSPEDLEKSVSIIKAGITKGQGVDHIFLAHKDELAFSKSSFYRHVRNRDVSILPLELRKAVKYKLRNKKTSSSRSNIPREVLEGRTYNDFLSLPEDEQKRVVECDCVEGPSDENDALFTMHFKALHFQIVFKLAVHDSAHVLQCFKLLHAILGDDFSKYFGVLMFDRGHEFVCVLEIEALDPGEIKTFFADAGCPHHKGAAEKNHVEIRKVIEKGASLQGIDMWDLSFVMSHVNSSLRHSTFGKSPMELAMAVLPTELFEHLGYELIPPDDVVLKPSLLGFIKRPSK